MIQKIEKLVSIGKFRDYNATGNVSFNKLTLFYADNGSGKTTLTEVLRPLTKNDPDIVRRRISTNATLPQAAQIIQRNAGADTYHTFGRSGWASPIQDIDIFDTHFVNENIYSGFDFNDTQRKQLHQFVIGAAGVGVRQQIEQNKIDKTASRQSQDSMEQQLILQVGNGLSLELINDFLNITTTQNVNIDQRIAVADTASASATSNAIIQTLPRLTPLGNINSTINFANLRNDLQATTTTLMSESIESLFENHCKELNDNKVSPPQSWLKTGYSYLENKRENILENDTLECPFCQQPLNDNLEIIKAYSARFNNEFNSLVKRLNEHLVIFTKFNLDPLIQALNTTNQSNVERINSWLPHLSPTIQAPIFSVISDEATLTQELQSAIAAIQNKLHNPSISVPLTEVATLEASLQTITNNITAYNLTVTAYNSSIISFLSSIQSVSQAQTEANRLRRIKKRFAPSIVTICTNLTAERARLKLLDTNYTRLMQQQAAAATSFFANYKDRINHYLSRVFKTPFQISSVAHVPPQGKAMQSKIDYKLTIDGTDISFNATQVNSVKDCLSEGDKSTIALAFFLSKLDIDAGTINKIIIFDDPLSSFDGNRRLYTVQLITELLPRIKQLVILSHNEYFLHEIAKNIPASSKTTLRIAENFLTHSAFIEPLSLDELVEHDYFRHVTALENFLANPDITKKDIVLGWMRNVLEAHIRFKFYRQVNHLAANDRTFGKLITVLATPPGVIFRDNPNRTNILNMLRLINGVSCKPHHGEPTPDYIALGVDPTTINVTQLAHLVQDTLNLVDNLL